MTTSFIAAGGSGRSTSLIPAVPAAWSVTTIAFILHLRLHAKAIGSDRPRLTHRGRLVRGVAGCGVDVLAVGERVVRVAHSDVLAGAAVDHVVVAVLGGEAVVAGAAVQDVLALVVEQLVVAGAAGKVVGA